MTADLDRYEVQGSCWVWTGARNHGGYGTASLRDGARGTRLAHRLMYERHNGPIPKGLELDHTCENPPCINPSHLDAVTPAEHVRRTYDRLGKSRLHMTAVEMRRQGYKYREIADALGWSDKASAHSAVRYAITKGLVEPDSIPRRPPPTEADRERMRELYRSGVPQTHIAPLYGLHPSQVSRIVRGLTSGHSKLPIAAEEAKG